MALVTVDDTELPTPSSYSALTSDIVNSGRNTNGVIVSSVIKSNVAKIEMSWNYLSASAWAGILSLFSEKFINSVTFYDQVKGDYRTCEMYVSDRSAGLVSFDSKGNIRGWSDCKLSLIEC